MEALHKHIRNLFRLETLYGVLGFLYNAVLPVMAGILAAIVGWFGEPSLNPMWVLVGGFFAAAAVAVLRRSLGDYSRTVSAKGKLSIRFGAMEFWQNKFGLEVCNPAIKVENLSDFPMEVRSKTIKFVIDGSTGEGVDVLRDTSIIPVRDEQFHSGPTFTKMKQQLPFGGTATIELEYGKPGWRKWKFEQKFRLTFFAGSDGESLVRWEQSDDGRVS